MYGIDTVIQSHLSGQGHNVLFRDVSAGSVSLSRRMTPRIHRSRSAHGHARIASHRGAAAGPTPTPAAFPLQPQYSPVSCHLEANTGGPVHAACEIHIPFPALPLNCALIRPIFLLATALIPKFI